jgi:SAM-dependent methyltransferase
VSRGLNEYDNIAEYKKSHTKPDKQYSMLPTVIKMVGDHKGKIVMDLGCGTGFFSLPFAEKAKEVIGIDNSDTQLSQAVLHPKLRYFKKDIFLDTLPKSDIAITTFVINYANSISVLNHFFKQVHRSLYTGGKFGAIVDLPNGKSLQKFGAKKTISGKPTDESKILIEIFNQGDKVCELESIYYTKSTIEQSLQKAGFINISWKKPIVSEEGFQRFGYDFWKGYTNDPELGYVTAEKAA